MLNGSSSSAFATQGVKRLMTDRADQLRHWSVPPYEFAEIVNNMIAATRQEPTTAYLRYMAHSSVFDPVPKQSDGQEFGLLAVLPTPCRFAFRQDSRDEAASVGSEIT